MSSLRQEIKDLQNEIADIRNKANIKEQGNAMSALISEVKQFVEAADKEKTLVSKINELRKKVAAEPTNPEEEQAYGEAMKMLTEAEALKRELTQKKSMLRRVRDEVKELERYLSKVAN